MMNMVETLNNALNYHNRAFDYGFKSDYVPDYPIYAALQGELVSMTVLPFNSTSIEDIERLFDAVDFAMVEELGRSKYLSSLQLYQFVNLRGLTVSRQGISGRLKKMMRLRVIREYTIKKPDATTGLKAYDLDFKGFQIARNRNVKFHMGNRFLSYRKKQELGISDSAEGIKRILTGNMIVLGHLMSGVCFDRFGIMETLRLVQETPITDDCILRTALNIQIDQNSILMYEIVRSTPQAMYKLADKVKRYYALINDDRYQDFNYYGYEVPPQLVICGESYDHCVRIDRYLRSEGLINSRDDLLYTEDLCHVQNTMQSLYELDEYGHRTWYSLPTNVEKTA